MPELTHECGKRVKFPSGTEGRRGKCPHCGGKVFIPGGGEEHPQHAVQLDAPPRWEAYQAYLEDRGPPPRDTVMPPKLMLKAEADERWEQQAQVRPSRFFCPSCKDRINVDQVVCTKCGLDFRSGVVLGKNARLGEKGMTYLAEIPWLEEARKAQLEAGDDGDDDGEGDDEARRALRAKAPRAKRTRRR